MTRPAALWVVACGAGLVLAASPWLVPSHVIHVSGPMTRDAVVHDRLAASVDAVYDSSGRTAVTVHFSGLAPHEPFFAYAYEHACGAADNRRYQEIPDRHLPSTDPAFSNPRNELWFTGTADARGEGTSLVSRDDQFAEDRRPRSVVLEAPPAVQPDGRRLPGEQLACLTVDF